MAMDPVSVGYLILTLVQVTKNAYSLMGSIKYSAPKVSQIYYRIESDHGSMGESNADSERDGFGDLDSS